LNEKEEEDQFPWGANLLLPGETYPTRGKERKFARIGFLPLGEGKRKFPWLV